MPLKLHNTLHRETEDFRPAGQIVKFYSCGPTVYSYYHLGNLRNAVFNDTLRRALELSGHEVKHVMNITDVGHLVSDGDEGEDKLEKGAQRDNKSVWEVAEYFTNAFKLDMKRLNILEPNGYDGTQDKYARATDFIDAQLDLVRTLIDKGFAYRTSQAIYFDTAKLDDYGKLTGQNLADKEVGARSEVVTDKDKKHPQDFAIWFFAVGHFADHTMRWDSPWGEGFPGWHLECSAIIHATLGDPIDIHTGGVDHIGTHHTNEIAQTEAAYGHELARFWVHNEHLLVDGKRMAKSAGNFFTLQDVIDKGHNPLALRLLFLQSHYRSQTNFTWQALEGARQNLSELQAWADMVFQASDEQENTSRLVELTTQVSDCMQNDLNTPGALAAINSALSSTVPSKEFLEFIDHALALDLAKRKDITMDQRDIIYERDKARQAKDWAKSDLLRDKLAEQGIELNDTDSGTRWFRSA